MVDNRTTFQDTVTTVMAAWLNSVKSHKHDGKYELGDMHCDPITLDELDPNLQIILQDLAAIRSLIPLLFYQDKPRPDIFGGYGIDGEYTGQYPLTKALYEFTKFEIAQGTTIAVTNGFTRVKVQGDLIIHGLILGTARNHYGLGKPFFNTGGHAYNIGVNTMGSGGGEAVDHSDIAGLTTIRDRGGAGGAGIVFEVLGDVLIDGSIGCNGSDGQLSQILQGTPSIGGSGGGSGGSITIQSYTSITVNGTIDCHGGRGSDGQGSNAAGGGGGSGGIVTLIAPSVNVASNAVNVSGGSPGNSTGNGSRQGAGGGGFGGSGGNHKASGEAGQVNITQVPKYSYH